MNLKDKLSKECILAREGKLFCKKGHKMTMCYIPICLCTDVTPKNVKIAWMNESVFPQEKWKHFFNKWHVVEEKFKNKNYITHKYFYEFDQDTDQWNCGQNKMILNIDEGENYMRVYWSSLDDDIMFEMMTNKHIDIDIIKLQLVNIKYMMGKELQNIFLNLGFNF